MQIDPGGRRNPSSTERPEPTSRRRRLLDHLRGRSDPVSEGELAARIAAGDREPSEEVPDDEVRAVHVALRHVDLPRVSDAGLVSWDESTGTLEPVEDPDLSETEVRQLFADGWDDAAAVSRYERRRAAIAVLRETSGDVQVNDVAAEVAAHETEDEVAPSASDVDEVGVALHHRHLPKLQEANLVEYDPVEGTVAYTGPSEPEREGNPDWSGRQPPTDRNDDRNR